MQTGKLKEGSSASSVGEIAKVIAQPEEVGKKKKDGRLAVGWRTKAGGKAKEKQR